MPSTICKKTFKWLQRKEIDRNMLSEYQMGLLDQAGKRRFTTPELVHTLFEMKKCTVHYITLNLYVDLGLKVTKVYRVLQFKQEKWLQPNISLNTRIRTQSRTKFEESSYKLMNSSCYGKTLETKRNRVNVKLVRTREAVLENSDKGLSKSSNIFDENLVAITSRRGLVGACKLDLSKIHMHDFHYNVSTKHQNHYFHPQD